MGSFHLLDNSKIRVVYPGNTRTFGRCHQPPTFCPGGGIARVCGEKGEEKVSLLNHMRNLWNRINYDPGNEKFDNEEDENLEPISEENFCDDFKVEERHTDEGSNYGESTEGEGTEGDDETDADNSTEINESHDKENESSKFLIPGLPKQLTRNQRKKMRRSKRKNVITPPDLKEPKMSKMSTTPPTAPKSPSLVTNLIYKYSSSDSKEKNEESIQKEELPCSSGPTSTPSSSQSSPAVTLAASSPGIVIPTGVESRF